MSTPALRRCAIYTRKSSEEGLEQGFNSLHAQREACDAYILSQISEGWTALPTIYDDGGFSGGNMERPGLKALMMDIARGLIDIVVVYKVDRLTRALSDFARIVERFDEHEVSFVSVTQAFNTTTSMGRLTLNVLLSFAQFEREVTGERIRDKIAQSKARGMWMGGRAPLGYNCSDHRLVVNPVEAAAVRAIFERYLELGSVMALMPDLKSRGVVAKSWTTAAGKPMGGAAFSRGALYYLLAKPVYRGAIRHHDKLYPDAHPAIVDKQTFDRVQAMLAGNKRACPSADLLAAEPMLKDRLFDDRGEPMRPVHTRKGSSRYRYYVSAALLHGDGRAPGSLPRIATGVIEEFVLTRALPLVSAGWRPDEPDSMRVKHALVRVEIGADRVLLTLRRAAIIAAPRAEVGELKMTEAGLELGIGIRLKHRQGAVIITAAGDGATAPRVDRTLIRAISLARAWANELETGQARSINDIAVRAGLCNHYAARMMPLAWLAPDLVALILEGRQPAAVSLKSLTTAPLPTAWEDQRALFDRVG